MPKSCRQLACDERCQIKALMSRDISMREIARCLGRTPATISREIARNRGGRGYHHRKAQDKSCAHRREASSVPHKLTVELWQRIQNLLKEGWSPEQTEGRLRCLGEETVGRE